MAKGRDVAGLPTSSHGPNGRAVVVTAVATRRPTPVLGATFLLWPGHGKRLSAGWAQVLLEDIYERAQNEILQNGGLTRSVFLATIQPHFARSKCEQLAKGELVSYGRKDWPALPSCCSGPYTPTRSCWTD